MASSISLSKTKTFVFKKETWETIEIQTNEGPAKAVKGIPGTWTLPPEGTSSAILALLCCPNCGSNLLLHSSIHQIDSLGKMDHELRCNHCSLICITYLDEWNKKPLYACAIEVDGVPQIHYVHATSIEEARIHLGPIRHKRSYRIVGIARAIGFIAEDNHGERLRA